MAQFEEASKDLDGIDSKAVAQLAGNPDWGAGITLARAEIAVRRRNYTQAQQYIESVRPVFSRPEAEAYQRAKVDQLAAIVDNHPQ